MFLLRLQNLKVNYLGHRVGVSQHQVRGQSVLKVGQFRFPSMTIILIAKLLIPFQLPKDLPSYHCLILEKVLMSQNHPMLKFVAMTIILIAKLLIPFQLPKDLPSYHCLILEKVLMSQNHPMLKFVAVLSDHPLPPIHHAQVLLSTAKILQTQWTANR